MLAEVEGRVGREEVAIPRPPDRPPPFSIL